MGRMLLRCIAGMAVVVCGPAWGAGDWAGAMTVALGKAENARQELGCTMGPWLAKGPLAATGFDETHVDPGAAPDGEGLGWTGRLEYADGVGHALPARDQASTYLYRRIESSGARALKARIGSDDGLQVWLNGETVWTNDVPRVVGGGEDTVDLPLRAGENHLLLKIYNRSGGHGFSFRAETDVARPLWDEIARDFPVEAARFAADLPDADPIAWFAGGVGTAREQRLVETVLVDAREDRPFRERLDALRGEDAPRKDRRWLGLYEEACRVRALTRAAAPERVMAVRRGVEDLAASFPERYDGAGRRLTLAACEAEARVLREAAARGEAPTWEAVEALDARVSGLLLANPLLNFDRLLVVKRRADRLGLPQNWQGNCSVGGYGYDNEIAALSPVRPGGTLATVYRPEGDAFVGDLDLHFDGDRMLVSMPGEHRRWQVWELAGGAPRQVTDAAGLPDVDNYDACYLPDGRIIFASTRCFQGVPCVGGADQVANLFQMEADGSGVRQLCFDQDHNWCPTVMNNGRVLFTRWEYSDTPHYFSRLLFSMNPDGTNQVAYYGSNSYWPNSMFYARPIPGDPTKFVAIVSGHHGVPRMGELVLFDVAKGRHEADGVVQRIPGFGAPVEPVIADQLVQDSWPRFLHPFPLSDAYFLVSCQPDPASPWGIYLADVFDNLTLLKEVPGYALFEPVPSRATPAPPAIPDKVRLAQDTATVYIADIYSGPGLRGVPRGTVKALRVMEFHYAYNRTGGHRHIGMEGPWDVRRILGTVPVQEDGSALFEMPANLPVALQPLDADGRAMQLMRSWFTAMPGEVVSCTGCHEQQNSAPSLAPTLASRRAPDPITPWYGPARGFSFPREVQPVLNAHCVRCHDGQSRDGRALPDFSEKEAKGWGGFTPSYLALHPYVRRPGPESDYHLLKPMEYHASTSPLIRMLENGHGGVTLDAEAMDRLVTWIDLNVPDHGTWQEQCSIPDDLDERRRDMREAFASRPEDPEAIPPVASLPEAAAPTAAPAPAAEAVAAAWSAEEGAGTRKTIDLGEGVTMDLVLVPAGSFVMGDADGGADARPSAPVRIDRPFWMGATEVTLAQFRRFSPGHDQGYVDQQNKDHTRPGYAIDHPDMPVVRVSYVEAEAWCAALSDATGAAFALPMEAQWEWACRAGAPTAMNFGTGPEGDFSAHANLADASLRGMAVHGVDPQPMGNPSPYEDYLPKRADVNDGSMLMSPVARYAANAWGLFDMHGNVAEWTRSAYRPYPYDAADGRETPGAGERRAVRGGAWSDLPQWATSACRVPYAPWQPVYNVGFRVVCPAEEDTKLAAAGG